MWLISDLKKKKGSEPQCLISDNIEVSITAALHPKNLLADFGSALIPQHLINKVLLRVFSDWKSQLALTESP